MTQPTLTPEQKSDLWQDLCHLYIIRSQMDTHRLHGSHQGVEIAERRFREKQQELLSQYPDTRGLFQIRHDLLALIAPGELVETNIIFLTPPINLC